MSVVYFAAFHFYNKKAQKNAGGKKGMGLQRMGREGRSGRKLQGSLTIGGGGRDEGNVFLNEDLKEEVLMDLSSGFEVDLGINKVCKLKKSLYIPSMPPRRFFGSIQRETCLEGDHIFFSEEDPMSCSNFVDLDWLSSSGNPCEEEPFERSLGFNSSIARDSSENVVTGESTPSLSEYGSSMMLAEQSIVHSTCDSELN
ncbi:phosphoinositide phosphatase SAC3 [Cucumis melo var. makuwa]|uniref:Phosphoinositide phosphatase SAC3 n=1 Tax=Cucumis melo var. makuwa TaxID=1194695 RepID=A0A5D3CU12_CUCMM|nr:phosphoinositide phosphatase SAC3 [Cucumis melo var. makuwa]